MPTKKEIEKAYNWAANQNYTSVAARYAKTLAEALEQSMIDMKDLMVMVEKRQHKLEKIRLLCENNSIMEGSLFIGNKKYGRLVIVIFRIIAAKMMEILEEEEK